MGTLTGQMISTHLRDFHTLTPVSRLATRMPEYMQTAVASELFRMPRAHIKQPALRVTGGTSAATATPTLSTRLATRRAFRKSCGWGFACSTRAPVRVSGARWRPTINAHAGSRRGSAVRWCLRAWRLSAYAHITFGRGRSGWADDATCVTCVCVCAERGRPGPGNLISAGWLAGTEDSRSLMPGSRQQQSARARAFNKFKSNFVPEKNYANARTMLHM